MELKWNDVNRRKQKYAEKNLFQCHLVHHKFHMDRSGTEPGLSQGEDGD
jgi:hypothetical protein